MAPSIVRAATQVGTQGTSAVSFCCLQARCGCCSERVLLLQASFVEPARYSAVAACGHLTVKEAGRWFRLVLLTRNADIRCAAGASHERHSHTILFEC